MESNLAKHWKLHSEIPLTGMYPTFIKTFLALFKTVKTKTMHINKGLAKQTIMQQIKRME